MKKKAINYFYFVRDIPYKIPTSIKETDYCCGGKHKILSDLLKSLGLQVRNRVCLFLWNSLDLPSKFKKISYENDCTHTYLEIKTNNRWEVLDVTWDVGLARVFHINDWDGKSNTEIAVKPIKIFSPQKSEEILNNFEKKENIIKDLKMNGKFYEAFNNWLKEIRRSKEPKKLTLR